MTKETKESGLAYANEILQDEWAPVLLFWLGFRTFTKQELLGLIIACGGCLVLLATDRFVSQHRSFITVVTGLFILLIIGYVIKVL